MFFDSGFVYTGYTDLFIHKGEYKMLLARLSKNGKKSTDAYEYCMQLDFDHKVVNFFVSWLSFEAIRNIVRLIDEEEETQKANRGRSTEGNS